MGHWHFLNSTGDRGNINRQRRATLPFLKIDMQHQDPQSRAPVSSMGEPPVADHALPPGPCREEEGRAGFTCFNIEYAPVFFSQGLPSESLDYLPTCTFVIAHGLPLLVQRRISPHLEYWEERQWLDLYSLGMGCY